MATKTLDQLLQENTQLTADLAAANAALKGAQDQVITLTAERNAANTAKDAAVTNAANLQTKLTTTEAELATSKAAVTDFDGKVAAAVAKHGIRPNAVAAEQPPAGKGPSLTERCLAAKNITRADFDHQVHAAASNL